MNRFDVRPDWMCTHDFNRGGNSYREGVETVSTVSERKGIEMSHSLTKVWIHAVWSTKDRNPLLKNPLKDQLIEHIRSKIELMDCNVRVINGSLDHLHALFLLCPEKTLANVMQTAKGESAHWINQGNFCKVKFAWQVGYCSLSVSPSMTGKVEEYIRYQEEHHRKLTFQEEYERFMGKMKIPTAHGFIRGGNGYRKMM